MKRGAYYNDFEPYVCEWLRNLIKAGLIPDGDVDNRSIRDVQPEDLRGYKQCHFFAGIGGWAYALRLAQWPDDREVWTGSCPCQPFSVAGKQNGFADDRHIWPEWYRLIGQCRPPILFGEQVAGAAQWLGLVRSDLEGLGYAVGAMPIEAASAGADHLRDRFWLVADDGRGRRDGASEGQIQQQGRAQTERASPLGDAARFGRGEGWPEYELRSGRPAAACDGGAFDWATGSDGKSRRVKSGIRLLAHGVPSRVAKLRAFGNAIDPRPASEFIKACM